MPAALARFCLRASLFLAVMIPSQSAAAEPAADPTPLLAPVPCGIEVQGTTYGGHGRNNWNLDLNSTGGRSHDDVGLPILAQADGTVVWFKTSGYNKGAGTYIEVDYGDVTARYVHLVEGSIPERLAEIGARVEAGEQLGELGNTGRTSGPHLHIEYWDSADHEDTPWYQLPRANHIPVTFEGVEMVATLAEPSPTVVSTNCPRPSLEERLRALRLWRYAPSDLAEPTVG